MIPKRIHLAGLFMFAMFASFYYGFANASGHSDALILYTGATDVWTGQISGTDQLTYHISAKFPASNVIGFISYKLHKAGWVPLTYDFLDPGSESSQVRGWGGYIDARRNPPLSVQQWTGDWRDASGDVVRYVFRYRNPESSTPNLTDLEVAAVFTPASVAKQELRPAERSKDEIKTK